MAVAVARVFISSFLVLFLEVALIRWMPAYIRLLAFFSNFILLAAFLGIGLGCLLATSRRRLFVLFPAILAAIVTGVSYFRIEVAVPSATAIYFTTGTTGGVAHIESTRLLPAIFLVVVALFVALAQRMGREMTSMPPLRGYAANIAGGLAGVAVFAVISWLRLPPQAWWIVASAAAAPLLLTPAPGERRWPYAVAILNLALLAGTIVVVRDMSRDMYWSPYYKIAVRQDGPDTVIEVNNMFHQSMAHVDQKEYFYQWPYAVFGDTFNDVLVLGAGSGTDVAAALRHGANTVDAVEIDPTILSLGRQHHPDRPYSDPRVHVVNDDARHFLRTSDKQYDLIVFALIDSLTLQSSFSGVRLESYMFTRESFEAARRRLKPGGLLVVYNYFRERWLLDRLANSAAVAFAEEPHVHVHEARGYLGVMLAGPRLHDLKTEPPIPDRVTAFGQSHAPSPPHRFERDPSIQPATDDWPFLYLRDRQIPEHYVVTFGLILLASALLVAPVVTGQAGRWSWEMFLLGAGFMLLETKAITQFALLWGATWVVASLAIVSVLIMALASTFAVSRIEIRRPAILGVVLVALLGVGYALPIGAVTFNSRLAESLFYSLLVFSPIFCGGLLFGSAIRHSPSLTRDYGTNLLGAMAGGVAEYASLVVGYRALAVIIALCYVGAILTRMEHRAFRPGDNGRT